LKWSLKRATSLSVKSKRSGCSTTSLAALYAGSPRQVVLFPCHSGKTLHSTAAFSAAPIPLIVMLSEEQTPLPFFQILIY